VSAPGSWRKLRCTRSSRPRACKSFATASRAAPNSLVTAERKTRNPAIGPLSDPDRRFARSEIRKQTREQSNASFFAISAPLLQRH